MILMSLSIEQSCIFADIMLYIFNLLFSCFYLSRVKEKNTALFIVKVFPVILLWVFIVGGQFKIGADYDNYLSFFSNPNFTTRFEPLFTWVSRFAFNFGIIGQGQFYVYAFINAVLIFVASHKLGIRNWGIFYFLLITVSTFFNNQMNGIRQCTAVAFVYWAFIELYTKKIKGILLILVAGGFHFSAIVCLLFTYIEKITKFLTRFPKVLLITGCLLSLIPADENINQELFNFLPEEIRDETHYEKMYANDDDISSSTGLIFKLSKMILLPIYIYSLQLIKFNRLSVKENLFFRFGILSYFFRCVLLINNLIGRFSYYFWIPSIIPLYYLCVNLYNRKRYAELALVCLYSSMTYFIKIYTGVAEYKSSFIYFQ